MTHSAARTRPVVVQAMKHLSAGERPHALRYADWETIQFASWDAGDGIGTLPLAGGAYGFCGTGAVSSAECSVSQVLEVAEWVSSRHWLAYFLLNPVSTIDTPDLGPFDWPFIESELLAFLRRFGDWAYSGSPVWPESRSTERDPTEVFALIDSLAICRFMLRTALGLADKSPELKQQVLREWVEFWQSDGWYPEMQDLCRFLPEFGDPPYPPQLRLRLIRLALAGWVAAHGVTATWGYMGTDGPLDPTLRPQTGFGLIALAAAVSAGAIRAPGTVEQLGSCDECGTVFLADRRRKRGGVTNSFCSIQCGNRYRARRFRANHSQSILRARARRKDGQA